MDAKAKIRDKNKRAQKRFRERKKVSIVNARLTVLCQLNDSSHALSSGVCNLLPAD